MSDTNLKAVLCPGCRNKTLRVNTHTHGEDSHIARSLVCSRFNCGFRIEGFCKTCKNAGIEKELRVEFGGLKQ